MGFPTACILASKEKLFKVIGIDKNIKKIRDEKISSINKNLKLFEDQKLNKISKKVIKSNKIYFSNKIENIKNSDVILVCINFDFKKMNQTTKGP